MAPHNEHTATTVQWDGNPVEVKFSDHSTSHENQYAVGR